MTFLSSLGRRQNKISRSICPENLTGEPGKGGTCPLEKGTAQWAARDLGTGWKVNPILSISRPVKPLSWHRSTAAALSITSG